MSGCRDGMILLRPYRGSSRPSRPGSRLVGVASCGPFLELDRARVGQRPQTTRADQRFIDAAEAPTVGRVDGNAERRRLAVHRAAGGDNEVGEGNEALRLDRAGRQDQRGQGEALDQLALRLGAREDDRVNVLVGAQPLQDFGEERVRLAVVERDVGGRADDDDDAPGVDRESARARPRPARSRRGSTPPSAPGRGRACPARRRSGATAQPAPCRGTSPAWQAGSRSGAG